MSGSCQSFELSEKQMSNLIFDSFRLVLAVIWPGKAVCNLFVLLIQCATPWCSAGAVWSLVNAGSGTSRQQVPLLCLVGVHHKCCYGKAQGALFTHSAVATFSMLCTAQAGGVHNSVCFQVVCFPAASAEAMSHPKEKLLNLLQHLQKP